MDIISQIKGAARRHILVTLDNGSRVLFRCKRLRAIDLVREGRPELLGPSVAAVARERQVIEMERSGMLEGASSDPEKHAAMIARFAQEDAEHDARVMDAISSDIDATAALHQRFCAWVCASIEAAGACMLTEAEQPDGLLPVDFEPERPLTEIKFVTIALSPDSLLVTDLGDARISLIATLIMSFTLPRPEQVQPFRQ